MTDRLAILFCQGGVCDIMVKSKAKPQHYTRPNARLRRLEKKKRSLYGYDIVVSYHPSKNKVVITRILACQLTESLRVTPDTLCTLLGLKNDRTWLHFLKNNNLQDSHNGLRGVLILIDYEVGLIVRSAGTHVLLQVLLPRSDRPQWKLVDLSQGNFHYGFFLQQIQGPMVGELTCTSRQRSKAYPYLLEGNLYMDPAGPHCFLPMPQYHIPKVILDDFFLLDDNLLLTGQHKGTSAHVRNKRRSKMGHVLYIEHTNDQSFTEMGANANKFLIPIGKPHNATTCLWNRTQLE